MFRLFRVFFSECGKRFFLNCKIKKNTLISNEKELDTKEKHRYYIALPIFSTQISGNITFSRSEISPFNSSFLLIFIGFYFFNILSVYFFVSILSKIHCFCRKIMLTKIIRIGLKQIKLTNASVWRLILQTGSLQTCYSILPQPHAIKYIYSLVRKGSSCSLATFLYFTAPINACIKYTYSMWILQQ